MNKNVTVLTIENNVVKQPTVYAEEATRAIMEILVVTSTSADPLVRAQVMDVRAQLEQSIFNAVEPIFRRCITAHKG